MKSMFFSLFAYVIRLQSSQKWDFIQIVFTQCVNVSSKKWLPFPNWDFLGHFFATVFCFSVQFICQQYWLSNDDKCLESKKEYRWKFARARGALVYYARNSTMNTVERKISDYSC